jgi:hypothetical protein
MVQERINHAIYTGSATGINPKKGFGVTRRLQDHIVIALFLLPALILFSFL